MTRQALGRGLNALIPGHLRDLDAAPAAAAAPAGPAHEIPVAEIRPNPYQPRTRFREAELRELADSIREQGVLQPILVVRRGKGYELVSGERRLRAVRLLGWPSIPAVVKPAAEARQMAEWALIENVQRDDLAPLEEARAYRRLFDEFQLSAEEVAAKVGKDRATVANAVRLLKLPPALQALLEDGSLHRGHARALLALEDPQDQLRVGLQAAREGWNVRQVEEAGRAQARRPPKAGRKSVDADVRAVEERIRRRLGTKVTLTPRGQGGRIEIRYFSLEELDRLLEILA